MQARRLGIEAYEMVRLFPQFKLWQSNDGQYYWEGMLRGIRFRIEYPRSYPLEPPHVFEQPRLSTHHHHQDGQLCLMKPGEWSPDFRAATVVGFIMRFLIEHHHGMTG